MRNDCYLVKVKKAEIWPRKETLEGYDGIENYVFYELPPLTEENLVLTNKERRETFGVKDKELVEKLMENFESQKYVEVANEKSVVRFNQGGIAHFLHDLETGNYYIVGVFKTRGKDWTWDLGKVTIATGISKNLEEIVTPEKIFSEGEEIFFTRDEGIGVTLLTPVLRGEYKNKGIIQRTLSTRYVKSAENALEDLNINIIPSSWIRDDPTITYEIIEDMLKSNIIVEYASEKGPEIRKEFKALIVYQADLGAIDHVLPIMIQSKLSDIKDARIKILDSEIDSKGKPLHRPIILLPVDEIKMDGQHIKKAEGYALKIGEDSYTIEETEFQKFSPLLERAVYEFRKWR